MKRNPWHSILLPELRAGRLTASEAARMADVSHQRIDQWCHAAGFNPAQSRLHWLTAFYARGLLRINGRSRIKSAIAPSMKAAARNKKPRQSIDKKAARAVASRKVINFAKAGGKVKLIPAGKRTAIPLQEMRRAVFLAE